MKDESGLPRETFKVSSSTSLAAKNNLAAKLRYQGKRGEFRDKNLILQSSLS